MSTSLLDQYRYTISDIQLLDPPITAGWRFHKSIFLLKIKIDTGGNNEQLDPIKGKFDKSQIVWSEQTLYDVPAESTITFKILMIKEKKGESETNIGDYANTMSGLLDIQKSFGICKVTLDKGGGLNFTVKEDRFKDMLEKAKQQSKGIHFARGKSWSTFFAYFDTVKTAVDPIAALNPYAKQIWSIVSMVPNILEAHINRNSNIKELLQQLMDIYTYINEADRLPVLKDAHGGRLRDLIDTTCECTDFIKTYAESAASENLMKGPIIDGKISEFKSSFDRIFKTIEHFLLLETRTAASNIENVQFLDHMPYALNVGLDSRKKCLEGTRETLIKEIREWLDTDTSARVLLLSGHAGTGKSSVAHTIAENLNDRLGSFFCFSRSDKGKVDFLFSTISRNLADRNDLWRRNLVQAIKDITIRKSFDPKRQFEEMIIKPSIGTTKPMVIIIDALDESGDKTEREILLSLLFERSSELPRNYRIIITSRPEDDIAQFHHHSNVFCKYMADVDPDDTLNDIQQFIRNKLSAVVKILDVVDKDWHLLLAQKAQSLFQWAKTACVYILELEELEAVRRLRTVLSKPTSSLYEMYHQILDSQPGCQRDIYLTLLKICVGAVIVSRKPLTVSALQAFFGPICGDGKNVKVILKLLNSLFIGTTEFTAEVRPIHTSLFDFFLSPEQKPGTSNRYYIDTADQSSFTHACLRVMNEMLRFNICGLETSHLCNRDVPNFDSRVAEAIPSHLSYACCFWAYHLEYSRLNTDILEKIDDLMRNKLLYFFEVLSLLGEVDHGRSGMQILIGKIGDKNNELAARAAEASQFVFEFGRMIMDSTPHLYLSSLPYISNETLIFQQFLPQYPQLLSMDVGQPITLRPQIKDSIPQRHPSACPRAVAFSPQGRQIACGFDNGDLWVWDYVTGEMISRVGPKEKPSIACKVVFSLNGELVYCCFRDGSILTWEAKTNKALYESNEGLSPGESHYCTISPDGRYIAFRDHQVLSFYERKTRSKLFEGIIKNIGEAMFSPSGSLFGFQSVGRVVRLWDTQRQEFISPFVSTTERWYPWYPVALHDNYVITCIYDCHYAYEVWDIRTRAMVHRLERQPSLSSSGEITFSPNGEYLLCSDGNKRWIWNISTGEITKRFVGHSDDKINSAALSADTKYIAFAMRYSDTMHVLAWDDLVQEETEDLSKDIEEQKANIHIACFRAEAWLKGQHLLSKVQRESSGGDIQVFDTTGMTCLKLDFQVDFYNWLLVQVSPEDNHWSIAYAKSRDFLCLWNIDEQKELILDRSDGKVTALAFSPTGDRLISGDSKGIIKIWHVRTRQLISLRDTLSGAVTALAFSPMGSGTTFWVAYRSGEDDSEDEDEGALNIEERECSESQNIVNGPFTHNSTNYEISLFSNNTYICMCSVDAYHAHRLYPRNLFVLDCSTGASISHFKTHLFPKLSFNRRYIAWIDEEDQKKVELWDLKEEGITLNRFPSDRKVVAFGFSNDSTRICILGLGGVDEQHVDIWDIETKGLVGQLFFGDLRFCDMTALYADSLLWVGTPNRGRIWDLHVHEIITRLYDDNLDNSQSSMLLDRHLQTERLIEDYKSRSENTEVLDYALAAWNQASVSPRVKLVDGWVLGPRGELIFWVPQKMRDGLLRPGMSSTTHKNPTKLNFDKFVHGTRWTECRK